MAVEVILRRLTTQRGNNIDADRWYLYVGVSSLINYNPPLHTSDILVCFIQVDVQSKEAIQIKTQVYIS